MFKERLITGLGLLLGALFMVLRFPDALFLLLSIAMVLGMAWEWAKLANLSRKASAVYLIGVWFAIGIGFLVWRYLLALSGFLWLLCPFILCMPLEQTKLLRNPSVHLGVGLLVLVPFWLALNMLQQFDRLLLVYLILIVIVLDSAAYGIGSQWGENKLAPHISPNKTWEGLIGGAITAFVAAYIIPFLIHPMAGFQNAHGLVMAGTVIIFAVIGDLFESLIKRQFNAKDSGDLLPGHGGILDRLDSLTAALPAVFCVLLFWGQYYRV